MTVEERLARMEKNLEGLAAVQDQMMDLLGFTIEGERRLATRVERMEEEQEKFTQGMSEFAQGMSELRSTVHEIGDNLNGLIGVVDGFIRREH